MVTSNETYFVSPSYPALLTSRIDPPVCIFTLQRNPVILKFPVCQIRIDFDEFSLSPHYNGVCGNGITDSFLVSGASNFNQTGLPTSGLCGEMTGQHSKFPLKYIKRLPLNLWDIFFSPVYLDVDPDKTDDPLLLIVNTANQQEYNRKWSIRIRQIPCKSQWRGERVNTREFPILISIFHTFLSPAPPGCLQYFPTVTGNVESFNYRTTNLPVTTTSTVPPINGPGIGNLQTEIAANYLNSLNYGVCVGRLPGRCAIKWQAIEFDFGGVSTSTPGTSTPGDQCVSTGQGGSGLVPDSDFVVIPFGTDQVKSGYVERYCGQKLSSNPLGSATNEEVFCKLYSHQKTRLTPTSTAYNSPFLMYVHTDAKAMAESPTISHQKGFLLKFQQVAC